MCDLLWSDPDDRCGWGISPRGAGYTFGQVFVSPCISFIIYDFIFTLIAKIGYTTFFKFHF